MNLATKLKLGYGYMAGLLLLGSAGAVIGFSRLADRMNQVVRQDLASVMEAVNMVEALERQDTAILARLLGRAGAQTQLAQAEKQFLDALRRSRASAHNPKEQSILSELEARFQDFRNTEEKLSALGPAQQGEYETLLLPKLRRIKELVYRFVDVNRDQAGTQAARARKNAVQAGVILGILAALAILSLGLLARSLTRGILTRLVAMKTDLEERAAGRSNLRLDEKGTDELALLAEQFNRILDAQQALRDRMQGAIAHYKQLVAALAEQGKGPGAVVGMDGSIIWSNLDEATRRLIEEHASDLTEQFRVERLKGLEQRDGETRVSVGETAMRATLLTTGPARPVAWLLNPLRDDRTARISS